MTRFLRVFLLAAALSVLFITQASALEYTVDAPKDFLFGRPTSEDMVYQQENPNVDRSKNTALAPPAFGSPTSYLPGSGEALTPNLVPGALSGGLVNQVGPVHYPVIDSPSNSGSSFTQTTAYTEVTEDLYCSNGSLGTLKIPSLGVNVKIYEGTDSAQLARGAGHFTSTSIWAGNVCVAAHNRGANSYFSQIHTLKIGDTITLTTRLGSRTYAVTSVAKVLETDTSGTAAAIGNQIRLYTCVRDESEYRWCVRGVEV